jgi:hypothetical protein
MQATLADRPTRQHRRSSRDRPRRACSSPRRTPASRQRRRAVRRAEAWPRSDRRPLTLRLCPGWCARHLSQDELASCFA